MMKVILTSDIDDIGFAGEVKNVKSGLARNYLIPHKLAIEATAHNLRDWGKKLDVLKEKREKAIEEAGRTAASIEGKTVTMESKISSGEKMFGSVTVQNIAEAMMEQHGISIEKKNILLEKNIKSIGTHYVPVRIKGQIKATLIVEVASDEEEPPEAAGAQATPDEQTTPETPETEESQAAPDETAEIGEVKAESEEQAADVQEEEITGTGEEQQEQKEDG